MRTKALPPDLVAGTLSSIGIEVLTQNGDELVALCPGHEARTGKKDGHPSWSINEESGVHYCFSCGYKGNLITLVRDLKGDSVARDLFEGFENHGGYISEELADLYDELGLPTPYADSEVHTANFKPESWLDDFTSPPPWARKERRISAVGAKDYEVLWDRDRQAWVFPLRDPISLRLLGYQIKSQRTRYFRNRPREVPKSETFFGWPAVREAKKIVLVESPLDAVLLADMEVPAVAICGSRLSDAQIELLQSHGFTDVYIWMDNDTAGELEVKRLKPYLMSRGVPAEFITPESYPEWEQDWKDVGDMPDATIISILDSARI